MEKMTRSGHSSRVKSDRVRCKLGHGFTVGGFLIRISTFIVSTVTSIVTLFASAAPAMPIEQFDKMAIPDQGDYVGLLLGGAQDTLRDTGKRDDLTKLNKLFSEVRPGDQTSIGMIEFETNLANVRLLDAERYAKDHSVTRLEVEHAMLLTLKRNGIVLTPAYMHVGDNFRPKLPLRYR